MDKIIGDNTDVGGFESALKDISYNVKEKSFYSRQGCRSLNYFGS